MIHAQCSRCKREGVFHADEELLLAMGVGYCLECHLYLAELSHFVEPIIRDVMKNEIKRLRKRKEELE
ncbi:MAG: hypothetical protein KatS3mg015_2483 [Fimbriimonadales bacterium]|nr:MAG: hypothetical protein KatS3mg015_2483 [Fimbriimonadales bacterium]